MALLKLVFYGFLLYLGYKIIFDFIIPVSRASKQIKSKIREAQEQQRRFQQQQEQANARPQASQPEPKSPPSDAEYIDFEEVK